MATQAIDYDSLAQQHGGQAVVDYDLLAAQHGGSAQPQKQTTWQQQSPMDALSKATGLSAGPGWVGQKWNEIKAGLTGAQPGEGLKPQPTALGNAAEAVGGIAEGVSQLGINPEMAQGAGLATQAKPTAQMIAKPVEDMLPSAKIARASAAFQHVSNSIGENTVATTDELKDAMDAIKENIGGTKPPVLNQLMDRLTSNEGPLTYDEARSAYHNLSDLAASDKMSMNKNMARLLGNFKSALGKAIQSTTDAAGLGDTYQGAMTDFATGSQQQEKLTAITDWLKEKGLDAAAKGVLGAGGAALGWDLYKRLFSSH